MEREEEEEGGAGEAGLGEGEKAEKAAQPIPRVAAVSFPDSITRSIWVWQKRSERHVSESGRGSGKEALDEL